MKIRDRLILGLIFAFLYFFFFPFPLGKELFFRPVWIDSISASNKKKSFNPDALMNFRLGAQFGFFTPQEGILYHYPVLYNVALAKDWFINYTAISANLVGKDAEGRFLFNYRIRGYPIIRQQRFFVLSTNRRGLAEWTKAGELKWQKSFNSIITSMDLNRDQLLVGKLNGDAEVMNRNGNPIFSYSPGGSQVKIIYGASISDNGRFIALISGLHPQKMLLLQKNNGSYQQIFAKDLKSDFRRSVFIKISNGLPLVVFEQEKKIVYVHLSTKGQGELELRTEVQNVVSNKQTGISLVLGRGDNQLQLVVFKPFEKALMDLVFPGKTGFLKKQGNSLFLGVDDKIMRVDLEEG